MAIERPRVRVYQESTTTDVTGVAAEMYPVLIGPSYHIRDYENEDDRDLIQIGTYGSLDGISDGLDNGRPLADAHVLELAEPPDNQDGAVLDAASLNLTLTQVTVELCTADDGVWSAVAGEENYFSSAAATFETDGVQAGDYLVIAYDGTAYSQRLKIRSVTSETALVTYKHYDSSEFAAQMTDILYRVERDDTTTVYETGDDFLLVDQNAVTVLGGATVDVDVDGEGNIVTLPVTRATMYLPYRSLRTDLGSMQTISVYSDIEATLGRIDARNPLAAASAVLFEESDARIHYAVGVVSDDADGYTSALGAIEARLDVYQIVPLTMDRDIVDLMVADTTNQADPDVSNFRIVLAAAGELIEEATIAAESTEADREVGSAVKLLATGTTTQFLTAGVASGDSISVVVNDSADVVRVVDRVLASNRLSVTTAFAGTTTYTRRWYIQRPNPGVLANLRDVTAYATSDNIISPAVAPDDPGAFFGQVIALTIDGTTTRHLITDWSSTTTAATLALESGNVTFTSPLSGLDAHKVRIQFIDTAAHGAATVDSVVTAGGITTVTIRYESTVSTRTELDNAIAGDVDANAVLSCAVVSGATVLGAGLAAATTHFTATAGLYNLLTAAVPGFVVVAATAFPSTTSTAGDTIADIQDGEGTAVIEQVVASRYSATESIFVRKPFSVLTDVTASFETGTGTVEVGDFVEIPTTPGDYTDLVGRFPVGSIQSDNRLTLASGWELPSSASVSEVAAGVDAYRIQRDLTKTQQAAALVEDIEARKSDRFVAVWPDLCTSSYVTDARTGVATQVGAWLLAAAVAGRMAARVPQASLTKQALSSISTLRHAGDYFSPTQLDTIVEGGLFVLSRASATSAPYVVVQALTDVDFLPRPEVSIRALYDYVSRQFKGVLEAFIGAYNITNESKTALESEVAQCLHRLIEDRRPRVGAPILPGSTAAVNVDVEDGTVEVVIDALFPKPWGSSVLRVRGR